MRAAGALLPWFCLIFILCIVLSVITVSVCNVYSVKLTMLQWNCTTCFKNLKSPLTNRTTCDKAPLSGKDPCPGSLFRYLVCRPPSLSGTCQLSQWDMSFVSVRHTNCLSGTYASSQRDMWLFQWDVHIVSMRRAIVSVRQLSQWDTLESSRD